MVAQVPGAFELGGLRQPTGLEFLPGVVKGCPGN